MQILGLAMPDMTTTEAAQYLADHGYTVRSKKAGTDRPPASELVKRWCEQGKVKARKSGWVWLVSQDELDRLIQKEKRNDSGKAINEL